MLRSLGPRRTMLKMTISFTSRPMMIFITLFRICVPLPVLLLVSRLSGADSPCTLYSTHHNRNEGESRTIDSDAFA